MPSTQGPKLGVGIDALMRLRDLDPAHEEPDIAQATRTAEEAGADAIVLTLSSMPSVPNSAVLKTLLRTTTQANLATPLSPAMIDFVSMVCPHSVYFTVDHHVGDALQICHISDASLQLLQQAVCTLRSLSVRVVVSIDASTDQLPTLSEIGITAVKLSTRRFSQTASSLQAEDTNVLRTAVHAATRYGIAVHLGGGISYRNVVPLAAMGTITQINVGHAITARAVVVGWQEAIKEMKALLVTAWAPSPNSATANIGSFRHI